MWNEPTSSPPSCTTRPSSSTACSTRPPGALARLEHLDVGAGRREVARGGEAGEAGAEDEHVAAHRSTWPCSGRQPMRTRSPSSQRSSARARAVFCSSATSRAPGPSSTISCVAVPM